jgi:sRNA-binding protein
VHEETKKPALAQVTFNAEVTAAIALLSECFPKSFSLHEAKRRPLKVGINADIRAQLDGVLTLQELGRALRCYCGNRVYLARMRAGAARIDLDGNKAGEVSPEDAAGAASRLAHRAKKFPVPKAAAPAPKRLTLADSCPCKADSGRR